MAAAFVLPAVPTRGMRALDNLEVVDKRDAREPGLTMGIAEGVCEVDDMRPGDGGTCGEGGIGGEGCLVGSAGPLVFSTGACANRRDSDEGPAALKELPRARELRSCGVGDWGKGSSTSGSGLGGPGVGSGVDTTVAGSDGFGEVELRLTDRRLVV